MKQLNLDEAEAVLRLRFKGKLCSFTYPGYSTVYGMVDEISFDTLKLAEKLKEVVIIMGTKRYSVSLECLHECLKLTKRGIT
jgi:hypothetical protein